MEERYLGESIIEKACLWSQNSSSSVIITVVFHFFFLLRYNLHALLCTHLKGIVGCTLTNTVACISLTAIKMQSVSITQNVPLCPSRSVHQLPSPTPAGQRNHCSEYFFTLIGFACYITSYKCNHTTCLSCVCLLSLGIMSARFPHCCF